MPYDYDVVYVKGSDIPHVDAMSHLLFAGEQCSESEEIATVNTHSILN